jgi:hypothetical protein
MAKEKKAYTRQQTEFVSPEMILSFPNLEQAKAITTADPTAKQGGYSFKCEGVTATVPTDGPGSDMYKATALVAWHEDPDNYAVHLFGRDGRFPRLNKLEMPKRDPAVYPYAIEKHMITFSTVYYPDSFNMADVNLSDPVARKAYDQAVAAKAPGVVKFCDPSNPAEVARVEEENQRRRLQGLPTIPESEYGSKIIRMLPGEYWPGCIVKIAGSAYWSKRLKTVLLSLDKVLFVRTGDRLVAGERSPDEVFKGFAPPASLAPPALPPFMQKQESAWAI